MCTLNVYTIMVTLCIYTREVLQDDSGRTKRYLNLLVLVLTPIQQVPYILCGDLEPIIVPYSRLQEDTDRIRQPLCNTSRRNNNRTHSLCKQVFVYGLRQNA